MADEKTARDRLIDELYGRFDAGLDKRDSYPIVEAIEALIDEMISAALANKRTTP